MDTGERVDPGWPVPRAAGCTMHDTLHDTVALPRSLSSSPLSCSVASGVAPLVLASGLPGFRWVCGVVGLGEGGLPDAGWLGSPPLEFPLGGADACTPRQSVTLLYGPSICTRSVQMDLRRNQMLRPFPTLGSGTLWVVEESLRNRRVSCLPRWTVCPAPHRTRTAVRAVGSAPGQSHWPPPQGRCHLGPLTNGPGRIPPFCVSSDGADTVTGGGARLLGLGPLPASPLSPFHPGAPPSAVLAFAPPLSTLGLSRFPHLFLFSQAPAVLCLPPAFSLCPSPLWHFACQFLGRAQVAWCPHCLLPVSPSGLVVTP